MTRFTRAKGSKASNERREEEATPWHVMRQQLAEQLCNLGAKSETNTSYNLKEILSNEGNSQKEEVWIDFGETKSNFNNQLKSKKEKNNNENRGIPKAKINNTNEPVTDLSVGCTELNSDSNKKVNVEEITSVVKERGLLKKGKLKNKNLLLFNEKSVNVPTKTDDGVRGNKLVMGNLEISSNSVMKRKIEEGDVESKVKSGGKKCKFDNDSKKIVFTNFDISKKKKNNRLQGKNVFIETPVKPNDNSVKFMSSTEKFTTSLKNARSSVEPGNPPTIKKRIKDRKELIGKPKNNLDELPRLSENSTSLFNSSFNEKKSPEIVKNRNFKQETTNYSTSNYEPFSNSRNYDSHENHYRKKNVSNFTYEKRFQTIIANGREIQIVKYQGFFVKKADADELKKLRKKLLAQNIPKEKLEIIMKLERRKAEKSLAREKKKVCYHCRQFGHNFSDCPDIKESDMVKTGVCFKCGSLEHSHFECKVLQHQEFRHAVCFVCKEQGHIARQCPLNSQGLYPKGGSCHLCGEVTHLRKDCPKAVEEKTTKSVTVDILEDGTVEDMSGKSLQQKETKSKKKKVIKFK